MSLALNVLVGLLIALGVSVGLFLAGGAHEERAARALASAEAALSTVRDPEVRRSVSAAAGAWEGSLSRVLRGACGGRGSVERALARAAGLRMALARRLVVPGAFLCGLGVLAGLLWRDRARDLVLYCSATYSYLGKVVALGAAAYGVFVALSPFAPPLWTLYPAVGVAALGAAAYVGHLPPRL